MDKNNDLVEISYPNDIRLFEFVIECSVCGENKVAILYDGMGKTIVLKCDKCGVEDYINL